MTGHDNCLHVTKVLGLTTCMHSRIFNTVCGKVYFIYYILTTALCAQAACGLTSDWKNISIPLCHWHKGHHYQYPAKHNTGNSVHLEAKYWANNLWYKQEFQAPGKILVELSIPESLWSGVLCRFDNVSNWLCYYHNLELFVDLESPHRVEAVCHFNTCCTVWFGHHSWAFFYTHWNNERGKESTLGPDFKF